MRPLLYTFILLLAACANNPPQTIPKSTATPAKHTDVTPEAICYVEDKHFNLDKFEISIQSVFPPGMKGFKKKYYPFDSLMGNILIVYDKRTRKWDTLDVAGIKQLPDSFTLRRLEITDISKDIAFDKLGLILYWEGDSDNTYSELIGYIDDTLRIVYEAPNPGGIVKLKRKDRWTLTGLCYGADEITGLKFPNFPLAISLRTFEGEIKTPDTLVTSFDTESTEIIHAWRISSAGERQLYDIPPGKKFRIDTVLNAIQTAIMTMDDSVILRTTSDQLILKIKVSEAG